VRPDHLSVDLPWLYPSAISKQQIHAFLNNHNQASKAIQVATAGSILAKLERIYKDIKETQH
jgi:hypothetical protein